MPSILSAEHSARVTTWDNTRLQIQRAKKISNRAKLIGFLVFNVVVWGLFLAPVVIK